jgi:hypothetical protein
MLKGAVLLRHEPQDYWSMFSPHVVIQGGQALYALGPRQ